MLGESVTRADKFLLYLRFRYALSVITAEKALRTRGIFSIVIEVATELICLVTAVIMIITNFRVVNAFTRSFTSKLIRFAHLALTTNVIVFIFTIVAIMITIADPGLINAKAIIADKFIC